MEDSFSFYKSVATGSKEPLKEYKEGNEDCLADIVINYKPLYYSMVSKYNFLGQESIFDVYIDCILDCLKRFEIGKGNQTFGSYLKVAFIQGCQTEISRNNRDKRKANIGTYNFDDIFDENSIIDSAKDEEKLNRIIAMCERREI